MNSAPSSPGRNPTSRRGPTDGHGPTAPQDQTFTAAVSVLIPAYDEQDTIAAVVTTAVASGAAAVIVIDDGSRDATARVAESAGAEVITMAVNSGKGGALWAGATHADTEYVVLLDADLVGLLPEHVIALAEPVMADEADMTRGVFKGGRWSTSLAQRITPQLNGQRALRRDALLCVEGLKASRYGVEVAITRHALDNDWRLLEVPLWNVTQVMKEEKRGWLAGVSLRLRMYLEIVRVLLRRDRR